MFSINQAMHIPEQLDFRALHSTMFSINRLPDQQDRGNLQPFTFHYVFY